MTLLTSLVFAGSAQPPDRQTVVYPQLVVGGGFTTILQLSNASAESWKGSLTLPQFGPSSGISWTLNGVDQTGLEALAVELPAWSTQSFEFRGTAEQDPVAGSLWIESDAGVERIPASSFFFRYEIGEELVDEVWSPPALEAQRVVFPVESDTSTALNTGVAVRFRSPEVGAQGEGSESNVRAVLLDEEGVFLAERDSVPEGAQFIDQLFSLNLGDHFLGALVLEGPPDEFYSTALRQRLLPENRFQLTGVEPSISDAVPPAAQTARYRVTFQANWSATTHPDSFPSGAHFSPLVGGTHNSQVVFWREGGLASDGIEEMAERGATGALRSEVQAAITSGKAGQTLLGAGGSSPGLIVLEFEMEQAFPLVTLVTMVAPSPDWFVGVAGLPLFEDGRWVDEGVFELLPYDAGTDSGISYASPDQDTQPPIPIREITGAPFLHQGVVMALGTFTFERLR